MINPSYSSLLENYNYTENSLRRKRKFSEMMNTSINLTQSNINTDPTFSDELFDIHINNKFQEECPYINKYMTKKRKLSSKEVEKDFLFKIENDFKNLNIQKNQNLNNLNDCSHPMYQDSNNPTVNPNNNFQNHSESQNLNLSLIEEQVRKNSGEDNGSFFNKDTSSCLNNMQPENFIYQSVKNNPNSILNNTSCINSDFTYDYNKIHLKNCNTFNHYKNNKTCLEENCVNYDFNQCDSLFQNTRCNANYDEIEKIKDILTNNFLQNKSRHEKWAWDSRSEYNYKNNNSLNHDFIDIDAPDFKNKIDYQTLYNSDICDMETVNTSRNTFEDLSISFLTEFSNKNVCGNLIRNAIESEKLMMKLFDICNPALQPNEKYLII